MDTTSVIILIVMFATSTLFLGIGLYMAQKHNGNSARPRHNGGAGDMPDNHANDASDAGDSSGGDSSD